MLKKEVTKTDNKKSLKKEVTDKKKGHLKCDHLNFNTSKDDGTGKNNGRTRLIKGI